MNPVPSYELIPFLAWLHERSVRVADGRGADQLVELAREFLQRDRGEYPRQFTQLLGLFQTCPAIREPDIVAQMDHFSSCGRCLAYVGRRAPGQPGPRPIGDDVSTDWRGVALDPLLVAFEDWLEEHAPDTLARVRAVLQAERSPLGVLDLHRVIDQVGDELRRSFRAYIESVRDRDPALVDRYRKSDRDLTARRHHVDAWGDDRGDHERGAQPLGRDESLELASRRLAESVRVAIETGYFDGALAAQPSLLRYALALVGKSPAHLAQTLEFISWLRAEESGVRITGNIPATELEDLALRFCEQRGYANARSFSNEAARWLRGAGPPAIVARIAEFVRAQTGATLPGWFAPRQSPLDRYGAVRFHGVFLFLSAGDFPTFVRENWRDLHHLTGDHLDVYYSATDLVERASGYELAAKLASVPLRVDALPAFLLWEDRLDASVTVPLGQLEHRDVIGVMQTIVQAIRDRCDLRTIAARGAARTAELRVNRAGAILMQGRPTLLINNGGVVGDTYHNEGLVGAMGPDAIAFDNVFAQDARKALAVAPISAADAATIAKLAETLAARQIDGIGLVERMDGARHLAAIATAAESGTGQEESVTAWRKWLHDLGDRSQRVMAVAADITTLAGPIALLLGLTSSGAS